MKMFNVKNKVLREGKHYQITRNAWLYPFPYIIFHPIYGKEGRFIEMVGIEMGWLHWSISFYLKEALAYKFLF